MYNLTKGPIPPQREKDKMMMTIIYDDDGDDDVQFNYSNLFFCSLQSALARQSLYVKFDPLVKAATPRSPGKERIKYLSNELTKLSIGFVIALLFDRHSRYFA